MRNQGTGNFVSKLCFHFLFKSLTVKEASYKNTFLLFLKKNLFQHHELNILKFFREHKITNYHYGKAQHFFISLKGNGKHDESFLAIKNSEAKKKIFNFISHSCPSIE